MAKKSKFGRNMFIVIGFLIILSLISYPLYLNYNQKFAEFDVTSNFISDVSVSVGDKNLEGVKQSIITTFPNPRVGDAIALQDDFNYASLYPLSFGVTLDAFMYVLYSENEFNLNELKTLQQIRTHDYSRVEVTSKIRGLGEVNNPVTIITFLPKKKGFYAVATVIFFRSELDGKSGYQVMSPPKNQVEIKISYLEEKFGDALITIQSLEGNLEAQLIEISKLSLNLDEKIIIAQELSDDIDNQAKIINALTDVKEEQIEIIKSLNLDIQEQAEMINALTTNLQYKSQLVSELQAENEEQADLISAMKLSFSDQADIINNLDKTIQDDAEIIKRLNLNLEDQAGLIMNLELTNKELSDLINDLTLSLSDQGKLINELNLKIEDDIEIINNLNLNLEEERKIIEELEGTIEDQIKFIEDLGKQKTDTTPIFISMVFYSFLIICLFLIGVIIRNFRRRK